MKLKFLIPLLGLLTAIITLLSVMWPNLFPPEIETEPQQIEIIDSKPKYDDSFLTKMDSNVLPASASIFQIQTKQIAQAWKGKAPYIADISSLQFKILLLNTDNKKKEVKINVIDASDNSIQGITYNLNNSNELVFAHKGKLIKIKLHEISLKTKVFTKRYWVDFNIEAWSS